MSTNKRKERRHKELLEAGREAKGVQARALVVQEKALSDLVENKKWLDKITEEHTKLGESYDALKKKHDDFLPGYEALVDRLDRGCAELRNKNDTIADLQARLDRAQKRTELLEALNHETKKLRRRLQEAKKQNAVLQSRINKEQRADVF